MARQRMGQHFLADPGWQRRIYDALPRPDQETWLEIGAGHGEITALLAAKARRVVAIEADPQLSASLSDRAAREWPNVEVVAGDVLKVDLSKWMDQVSDADLGGDFGGSGGQGCRVYGNLPYYITSPILHRLFDCADQIASIHVVIQLEVAERIVAPPGVRGYGYLSVASQYYARPEIAMRIPPGAFRPPPKVTSALVHLALPGERAALGVANDKKFLKFVQICFEKKRKLLRNSASTMALRKSIDDALQTYGIRPDARAEQLTLEQFGALYRELNA
jgi:16S rRNA (adenine1518-N6/adenine1519-N6)-dimethyltransferase